MSSNVFHVGAFSAASRPLLYRIRSSASHTPTIRDYSRSERVSLAISREVLSRRSQGSVTNDEGKGGPLGDAVSGREGRSLIGRLTSMYISYRCALAQKSSDRSRHGLPTSRTRRRRKVHVGLTLARQDTIDLDRRYRVAATTATTAG